MLLRYVMLLGPVGRSRRRGGSPSRPRRSGRTGSLYGFLFSVQGKLEGLGQVQGGFVQRQAMDRSPEIQHVPLEPTIRVEALKDVLAQMDREGSLRGRGLAVHRARATALLATAAQAARTGPDAQAPVPWSLVRARMRSRPWDAPAGVGCGAGLTGGGAALRVEVAVVTTSFAGKSRLWPTAFSLAAGVAPASARGASRR